MSHCALNFRLRHNRWQTRMSSGLDQLKLIFNRLAQKLSGWVHLLKLLRRVSLHVAANRRSH